MRLLLANYLSMMAAWLGYRLPAWWWVIRRGIRRRLPRVDGAQMAARVADAVGSWRFIGAQAAAMGVWVCFNTLAATSIRFDGYPFVFLNLAMSAEAAFTGPILLIAANVAAVRDRALATRMAALEEQNAQMLAHLQTLVEQMAALARVDHEEHGRLLADLHSHTTCAGHTVIESASEVFSQPTSGSAA